MAVNDREVGQRRAIAIQRRPDGSEAEYRKASDDVAVAVLKLVFARRTELKPHSAPFNVQAVIPWSGPLQVVGLKCPENL